MKNVAIGGGILTYSMLIDDPTGIQTQDTWPRSFGPALPPSVFLWSHQLAHCTVYNVLMGQDMTWSVLANT